MPSLDFDRVRELIIEAVERDYYDDSGDGIVDMLNTQKLGDLYQLRLMEDAGFIEGKSAKDGLFFVTLAGNDFYQAVRDKTIWEKTKSVAADARTFTLNGIFETAKSVSTGVLTSVLVTSLSS